MKRDAVLIIDDMEVNRILLAEIFKGMYRIFQAENGEEGLKVLKENSEKIACILLDLEMPVMSGFEFLEKFSKLVEYEKIPVLVVTVDVSSESQLRVLDYGVSDFVAKPFNPKIILKRVKNAVSLFEYRSRLEGMVESQTFRIEEKERELASVNQGIVDALSTVVEFRDLETGEHVQRIKTYTRIMCDALINYYPEAGVNEQNAELIVNASAMHDIGKIAIPDAILLKPGKLTREEFEVIKTHSTKGAEILDRVNIISNTEYLRYCRNIILYHHEKYDGKGYPKGLTGEEIPIEAQIVSIADVFDALVSKRIYKDPYSIQASYQMILDGECGQFSERILDCFKKSFFRFEEVANDSFNPSLDGVFM